MVLFFFVQAEDGIRDGHVTGVQTCALPISSFPRRRRPVDICPRAARRVPWIVGALKTCLPCVPRARRLTPAAARGPVTTEMSSNEVYAIVKAGGRQEKVSVSDGVVMNKVDGEVGQTVNLTPLMLVDGDKVTTGADDLAKVTVTAEIVRPEKGKKITIQKFKNKTGYRKRQGHRQLLTRVKVTGIN